MTDDSPKRPKAGQSINHTKNKPQFDEAATIDLLIGWGFVDEMYFPKLFLDAGPALVSAAMVTCEGDKCHIDFAYTLLEPSIYEEPQHWNSLITSESRHSQRGTLLVIEAVSVVGPLRDNDWQSNHEWVIAALSHLRELILKEINEAVSAPNRGFMPELASWMAEDLPSAEELLDSALEGYRAKSNTPTEQKFLVRLENSKRSRAH